MEWRADCIWLHDIVVEAESKETAYARAVAKVMQIINESDESDWDIEQIEE